jgi:hypothetical protein
MKKLRVLRIVTRLLEPVLSYCHPSPSRGVLCFQWRGSGNCFVCWYSYSGLRCINFVHADYSIQISHQRYISAVIHTALLNNVRKVSRLVLYRTSCLKMSSVILHKAGEFSHPCLSPKSVSKIMVCTYCYRYECFWMHLLNDIYIYI